MNCGRSWRKICHLALNTLSQYLAKLKCVNVQLFIDVARIIDTLDDNFVLDWWTSRYFCFSSIAWRALWRAGIHDPNNFCGWFTVHLGRKLVLMFTSVKPKLRAFFQKRRIILFRATVSQNKGDTEYWTIHVESEKQDVEVLPSYLRQVLTDFPQILPLIHRAGKCNRRALDTAHYLRRRD